MNAPKPTVLIVDDEQTNRTLLYEMMKDDCRIILAKNGNQALKRAQEYLPDLILLDVIMPEMDGYETLRQIKSDPLLRDTPIIMISALNEISSIVRCIEMGAEDYLPKPFDPVLLRARVGACLEKRRLRNMEVEAQKKIAAKNKEILESISYAKTIQAAVLPSNDMLKKLLKEHFVIWEPKDIVGGDIYAVGLVKNGFMIAAIDCTGHGVPGALMTMITISSINQFINSVAPADSHYTGVERRKQPRDGCSGPAEMLQRLNNIIKISLYHQTDGEFKTDNGLEIGICWFDLPKQEVTFAGARFPLLIAHEGELTILEGDRQPLGYREVNTEYRFNEQKIPLHPGQRFYMYSDGFTDQIGANGLPFGKRRLRQLIQENSHLEMGQQSEIFRNALSEHQKGEKRRDDITLLGWEIHLVS